MTVLSGLGSHIRQAVFAGGFFIALFITTSSNAFDVSGTWDSSLGKLELKQVGNSVRGHYSMDNGEIIGDLLGDTFNGFWIEDNAAQRCPSPMNGRYYWGKLRIVFDGSGGLKGQWGYCSGELTHTDVSGRLVSAAPPQAGPLSANAFVASPRGQRDYLGGGESISPNGSPDSQLRLNVTAPGKTLSALELRNTNGQYSVWDTIPGNGMWLMAVAHEGTLLNDRQGRLYPQPLSASEKGFDLFVHDNGAIEGGRTAFQLTLFFADGSQKVIPVAASGRGPQREPEPVRPQARTLFDNWNKAGVSNAPARTTQFTLYEATTVTTITNYHWNDGRGQQPGSIALFCSDGRVYGPWRAVGTSGTGGAQNVNWRVSPNVTLPPGTYTVVDSDIATWSHNPQSGGAGFSSVSGN